MDRLYRREIGWDSHHSPADALLLAHPNCSISTTDVWQAIFSLSALQLCCAVPNEQRTSRTTTFEVH